MGPAYPASVLLLFANIILGGATRTGYFADVLLQFFSVPFLLLAVWLWLDRLRPVPGGVRLTPGLAIGAAMAVCGLAIALAQLVPLFGAPGWSGVSARIVASGGAALEGVASTGSSSVDPAASLAALPAVLPALALFLLVSLLSAEQRLGFVGWAVAFGFGSLAVGVLQVLQGPGSALRFFEISNRSEAIGFFANRNHFAAQLYVTLLLGVAWFVARDEQMLAPHTQTPRKVLWLSGAFCVALLLLAGIALARSRAGILLALVGLAAVVAMSPTFISVLSGREPRPRRVRSAIFVVLAALILLVGQLGAERFLSRFDAGLVDKVRASLNATTLQATLDALPFGTGLGTFTAVFPVYEGSDTLSPQYVNRAHDDWLEFLLETGVAGGLLLALFLAWFGERIYRVWIARVPRGGQRPRIVQQCASLAVFLLMLHSFVDYPLRTATMLAYFAACCALMTPVARMLGAIVPDRESRPGPDPDRVGAGDRAERPAGRVARQGPGLPARSRPGAGRA